ncbi:MAG: hypothetical protein QY331_10265 [Melioribacteraceae bacterium]|nr:MAG: hypothetical protein QY331_10265 [Melioribacteraceae bacterium]
MKTTSNLKTHSALIYFFLLPLSFILVSCNTTEPPPPVNGNDKPKPKITLTVDDTSPTEVWLNLITENISLSDTLKLIRNNDTVKTIALFDSNYVIYEDSLLPSQTYVYQVSSIEYQVSSEQVAAVTMDTTSHNFTWEVFEFGEHGNSILRDVAIIDENNIWAVGAIYLKDSTGTNDSKAYNAVHWDGTVWTPKRILYYGECSAVQYPPFYSVYAFSENEIALTNGGSIGWFDGKTVSLDCGVNPLLNGAINKIWGTRKNDIYIVGGNGSIAHYNGTSWLKIESGTDVDLLDVWGDESESQIFITGMDDSNGNTVLLSVNNSSVQTLYDYNVLNPNQSDLEGFVRGVWFNEFPYFYLLTSSHVTRIRKDKIEEKKRIYEVSPDFTGGYHQIRGSAINDMMIVGNRNHISHYNGRSWKEFTELFDNTILLTSVSINEDLVLISGRKNTGILTSQAVIIIGKR